MNINTSTGVCLSKMLPSHINNLAEAYSRIAEGKKSEEEVKDWNRKDDNPEGKKVDKKKVDKCTCESFYLKRLQAMNPVYAEQYLAFAEVLIGEGYESSRLLDNIIEALPKEVVGHEFRAALQAVNPRIYENLQHAEKKQARAIAEQLSIKSPQEWWKGVKSIPGNLQKTWQQFAPPPEKSADPNIRAGGSYTGPAGTLVKPYARVAPAAAGGGTTPPPRQPDRGGTTPPPRQPDRGGSTGSAYAAPRPAPKPFVAQTGDKAKDEATWRAANPRLAQVQKLRQQGASRAEINKVMYNKGTSANTPSVVKSSYEPDGNLIDENLKKGIKTAAKYGGLGLAGVALNKLDDAGKLENTKKIVKTGLSKAGLDGGLGKAADHGWFGLSGYALRKSIQKNSFEPTGDQIDESEIGDRARRVVGDQRQGVHGDADAIKRDMDATRDNLLKLRPYGVKGFPSVKKDTKKTTQVAHFEPEGELVDESGYFPTPESRRADEKKYNLSRGSLPGQVKHRDTTTQAKVKPKLRSEEIQMEGIRDKDPEKGTEERKERLEKKRGHKVDDHPQYKKEKDDDSYLETNMKKRHENNEKARKEMAAHKDDTVPRWMKDDFNLYDIILTYLDENGLMDSVEHAEAIMEQLTGEQIESIVEEILGEDPVQDFRDMRRAAENKAGARGPELSHSGTPGSNKKTTSGLKTRNPNKPDSSVSSPGYDTRRIGGYDLRRFPK